MEAVQERIRAFAAANPTAPWVLGRGWLYGSFPGGLPTREQLDAAVPDRPAYMECYDGHSGWANSKALALAGITRDTPDPPNGSIVRDPEDRRADRARSRNRRPRSWSKVPAARSPERRYALLLQALRLLNSQGITSVAGRGLQPGRAGGDESPLLERARREGKLTVRITAVRAMQAGDYATRDRGGAAAGRAPPRPAAALRHREGLRRRRRSRPTPRPCSSPTSDDPSLGPRQAQLGAGGAQRGGGGRRTPPACRSTCTRSATAACAWRSTRTRPRARRTGARDRARPHRAHRDHRPRRLPALQGAGRDRLHAAAAREPGPEQRQRLAGTPGPTARAAASPGATSSARAARLVFGSDWPVVTSDVLRGLYCAVDPQDPRGRCPRAAGCRSRR